MKRYTYSVCLFLIIHVHNRSEFVNIFFPLNLNVMLSHRCVTSVIMTYLTECMIFFFFFFLISSVLPKHFAGQAAGFTTQIPGTAVPAYSEDSCVTGPERSVGQVEVAPTCSIYRE